MTQFILKIKLGNEAMQTGYNVSRSLNQVADRLNRYDQLSECKGSIMDINGNTVGSWQVK